MHKTEIRQKSPEGKLPVSKTSSKASLNISLNLFSLHYLSWANTIVYSLLEEDVPGTQEAAPQAGLRSASPDTFLMLPIAGWPCTCLHIKYKADKTQHVWFSPFSLLPVLYVIIFFSDFKLLLNVAGLPFLQKRCWQGALAHTCQTQLVIWLVSIAISGC